MSKEITTTTNTELAAQGGFATSADMEWLNEAMSEDCAGIDLQLDRLKIPAGGSIAFEVPGADEDDTQMVKEIVGVVLFNHPANAYYKDKYTGGSNPPDCSSFDGKIGNGTPGGDCLNCPYNKFGSGDGKSKACKNRRMLYILREGELFPVILNLPVGSSVAYKNYVKHLLTKRTSLSRVVTSISLKKAMSESNIAYSQAVFKFIRPLTAEEITSLAPMIEQMKTYASNLTTADAFIDEEPIVDPATGEVIEPLK
ncbi:MAG: hypothetical protein NC093_10395 [Alistipes sp.]|nr:hypothetical protein [Alistipes sp.]